MQLLAKHAILLDQVVDDLLLAALDPASNAEDPKLQDESVHPAIVSGPSWPLQSESLCPDSRTISWAGFWNTRGQQVE